MTRKPPTLDEIMVEELKYQRICKLANTLNEWKDAGHNSLNLAELIIDMVDGDQ